jgi:hypothetical protein
VKSDQILCLPLCTASSTAGTRVFSLEMESILGNGRGFVTPEGLRVRVPEGKGGGSYILTLIPLYP